jgi:hypothetical protein
MNHKHRSFFFDINTTWEEYFEKLKGDGSPDNWLFLMDRYACASDKGRWSIYCERENDVAAIAIRNGDIGKYSNAIDLLKARSVRSMHLPGAGGFFDFGKLVPDWRTTIKAEYVPSGTS